MYKVGDNLTQNIRNKSNKYTNDTNTLHYNSSIKSYKNELKKLFLVLTSQLSSTAATLNVYMRH